MSMNLIDYPHKIIKIYRLLSRNEQNIPPKHFYLISTGDIIHLYDIYPDLANHNKHHGSNVGGGSSHAYITSLKRPAHSSAINSHGHSTSTSHSALSNSNSYPAVINNHQYQISSSSASHYTTNRPQSQAHSHSPYKPITTRPGGFSSLPGTWDHDTNHIGGHGGGSVASHTGITNHLDSFFDVPPEPQVQRPVNSLDTSSHSLGTPNEPSYAVGNVLDLNTGEAGEDYTSGSLHTAGSSYRPVPGI